MNFANLAHFVPIYYLLIFPNLVAFGIFCTFTSTFILPMCVPCVKSLKIKVNYFCISYYIKDVQELMNILI